MPPQGGERGGPPAGGRGGGNPAGGGGGGNPTGGGGGGNPPGGGGQPPNQGQQNPPPNPADGKILEVTPLAFTGERARAEEFINAIEDHFLLNHQFTPYHSALTRIAYHISQSFFSAPSAELKVTNARKLRMGPSQWKSTNIPLQCMGPYL